MHCFSGIIPEAIRLCAPIGYISQACFLSAAGRSASLADQTAFLVNQGFMTAVRTFHSLGFSSVLYIFFRARSTPFFQVLMFSLSNWSEPTSLMTCSIGIRQRNTPEISFA